MELLLKTLDIMFRRLSPEQLIRALLDESNGITEEEYLSLCITYAESTLNGYSWNEQEHIFRLFGQSKAGRSTYLPMFDGLLQAADRMLTSGENGPECRFAQALHWREAYLTQGQDLFTCAWLARQPDRRMRSRFFSWPAVIPSDNRVLRTITEGAAENHMHLYAGASVFSISWACLMNHPENALNTGEMEKLLQAREIRGVKGNLWLMRRKMLYAAFLRAELFKRIQGEDNALLSALRHFDRTYFTDELTVIQLKEEIDALRHLYGLPVAQPEYQDPACLDYAFTRSLSAEKEEDSRLLAGERYLLFNCFQRVFEGRFTRDDQWVFYIYLLLKAQLRSEIVQVNRQVGFANFVSYDDRKKLLWKNYDEYLLEDIRQSINAPLREQRLSSLEGRLSPKGSPLEIANLLQRLDKSTLFFEPDGVGQHAANQWTSLYFFPEEIKHRKHFYVIHFPKAADQPLDAEARLRSRHEQYRMKIRKEGIALAKALANYPYLCMRIRGIDACAQEIVCRPEVFSVLFRFLRSFRPEHYWDQCCRMGKPRLNITYHVGEDFLDIADGLRAMDEALHFLGLCHGDRFGHALALGVDPVLHYQRKTHHAVLQKQDLLDNLTWLYYRAPELRVVIPEPLRDQIRAKARTLFDYLYGSVDQDSHYSIREYYNSMFLRGDDPHCYQSGSFEPIVITDQFDLFSENNDLDPLHSLTDYRINGRLTKLCYLYHYGEETKRRGQEPDYWTVDVAYIGLMKCMQQAMRELISRRGISIECNPSSNVLIGTFGSYQNHPVMTFNNQGLIKETNYTQMHVSINSDDPGVFDTTVSFEYTLIARALCEVTDETGTPIYSERQVEDYLRSLVRMGKEQVFPAN